MYNASKMEALLRDGWQMSNSELERIMSECREDRSSFITGYGMLHLNVFLCMLYHIP